MAGTLISFLIGCTHNTPSYYGSETTENRTGTQIPFHQLFKSSLHANAYSVPKQDRSRHQRCVFFALENLKLGEKCEWHSPNTSARGEVKVVQIYPSGHRYCHVFFTYLRYNGQDKKWQDTACWSPMENNWSFISKL